MKILTTLGLAVGVGALAACQQTAQENAADNIEANAENVAENIEANAANVAENIEMNAENTADAIENAGDNAAANNTANSY